MTCTTKYVVTPVHEHDEETCGTARAEWMERITGDMPATFDLIYVARGDRLTNEQARYYVRGDWERLWDSLSCWEGDARWYGVRYWVEEAEREHGDNPPTCPDCGEALCAWEDIRDDLEEYISERDSGDWFDDLVGGDA